MSIRRLAVPLLALTLALASAGCAGCELPSVGANDPGGVGVAPPNPGGGGGGNVGGGNVGGGGVVPDPAPGGGDPNGQRPSIEDPVPGQLNPVPVGVWTIEPSVDGRHVTVLLSWWSGPAPCSVLDSVEVVREGTTITMTPREGADRAAGDGQLACPAIAMLRGTIVDLGELAPGTWTLAAHGDLAPIQIAVE
jgi:hypothetical protein